MNKFYLILLSALLSSQSWAATQALFFSSNEQVKIIVQGADSDAVNLSQVLNVPAVDDGSTLVKHVSFKNKAGVVTFDALCTSSKVVINLASCTLTLSKSAETIIRADIKYASYILFDKDEARRFSELFTLPAAVGDVFVSSDKNLKIPYYDPNGLGDFGIVYAQFH